MANHNNWQPSASLQNLQKRAQLLKCMRDFFAERNILEVETPLLCHTSVTDPFITSIPAVIQSSPNKKLTYYLQTSPEYAMKRLLASGSGDIYQISKAFRQGEIGQYHNPEFTMLEWYRLGFDHHHLMHEVDELLQRTLQTKSAEYKTYADLFAQHFNLNPHTASTIELINCAKQCGIHFIDEAHDRDTWLNLLMTHHIEPQLGHARPCIIFDFPPSQAALARIQSSQPPVAARFEVYVRGIELANGFHELQNTDEQRQRFENNLQARKLAQLELLPIDEYLLAALAHGLPDCAGVALGVDRLMMLACQAEKIADVLSFDFQKA